MRRFLIVLLLMAAAVPLVRLGTAEPEPFYLGGIQVNEPDHQRWVATLEQNGFNTVQVTAYAKQGDWDSANLWWEEEEPWVVEEIRSAKQQGLQVVLVLRLALDHAFPRNRHLWHGMVMPRSDAELAEWFQRYSRFALLWADIARREGVDLLAVGSELNSMTNTRLVGELPPLEEYWTNAEKVERERRRLLAQADGVEPPELRVAGRDQAYGDLGEYVSDRDAAHREWGAQVTYRGQPDALERFNRRRARLERGWRQLVGEVRQRYAGPLTYAANFDQYQDVGFWDELDLISINAYFPLLGRIVPQTKEVDLEALFEARWTRILRQLDRFRVRRGLPEHRVLFTEIGYVRRTYATVQPWAATGFTVLESAAGPRMVIWDQQPPDLEERSLAVRGLYRAHRARGSDLLAGLLYWKLSTVPSHEEVEPFVLLLGDQAPPDPLRAELARFGPTSWGERAGQWASRALDELLWRLPAPS